MSFIPDFFVVGAMKSGTTTLHNSILQAPPIQLTKNKEVNYFLRANSLNELNKLYQNQFGSTQKLKGDISPSYSKVHLYPEVPERIYKANPNAKIIYIVRDPYERLVSHLHHNLLRDRYSEKKVETEVLKNNDYILTSSYFFQLSSYSQYFSNNRILLLSFEDLKVNPEKLVSSISTFLGVSGLTVSDKRYYDSESRYKIKFYDIVHDTLGNGLFSQLYNDFWYLINIKAQKPLLSVAMKEQIIGELRRDVIKLVHNFQLDISNWKNFN